MKRICTLLTALILLLNTSVASAELKAGAKAPEFSLKGSDGKTYKLSELTKKKKLVVVVAWYPKAFTGG